MLIYNVNKFPLVPYCGENYLSTNIVNYCYILDTLNHYTDEKQSHAHALIITLLTCDIGNGLVPQLFRAVNYIIYQLCFVQSIDCPVQSSQAINYGFVSQTMDCLLSTYILGKACIKQTRFCFVLKTLLSYLRSCKARQLYCRYVPDISYL